MGKLSVLEALLGVGEGDVEKLGVGAHDLLSHLLEGLLLLLSLLLEGLLLLLGLLHPLLGRLLEGLLLLLGLLRHLPCPVHASFGHIFSLFGDECACLCVPIWAATEP